MQQPPNPYVSVFIIRRTLMFPEELRVDGRRWQTKPQQSSTVSRYTTEHQNRLVYLGPSPHHAWSVHMILSIQNGHISPQFHVHFDNMFETINDKVNVPPSRWQTKTRLANLQPQDEPKATVNNSPNNKVTAGLGEDDYNTGTEPGGEQNELGPRAKQEDNEPDVIQPWG